MKNTLVNDEALEIESGSTRKVYLIDNLVVKTLNPLYMGGDMHTNENSNANEYNAAKKLSFLLPVTQLFIDDTQIRLSQGLKDIKIKKKDIVLQNDQDLISNFGITKKEIQNILNLGEGNNIKKGSPINIQQKVLPLVQSPKELGEYQNNPLQTYRGALILKIMKGILFQSITKELSHIHEKDNKVYDELNTLFTTSNHFGIFQKKGMESVELTIFDGDMSEDALKFCEKHNNAITKCFTGFIDETLSLQLEKVKKNVSENISSILPSKIPSSSISPINLRYVTSDLLFKVR